MKPSDAELALYRDATSRAPWPGPDCPERDELERLAIGDADALETRRVVDHLVDCAACAGLVRDLRRLEGWAERAEQASPRPARTSGRTSNRRVRWPLALAAAALVALALAFLAGPWRTAVWEQAPPTDDGRTLRQGIEASITPAHGASVESLDDLVFAWPAVPGATAYRLRLQSATGEDLWTGPWDPATSANPPRDVTEVLADGVYTWSVDLRGGAATDRLGPFVLVVDR
ncbi:MAG: hypothetical protein AAGC60_27100 [Acidobacteriota bacterium]